MAITNPVLSGSPRLEGILSGGAPVRRDIPERDVEDVKKIQRAMQKLTGPMPRSFPPRLGGEADGVFGNETTERIIAFQKRMFPKDWREWDGRVGKNTLQAMNDELDKGVAPVPPAPAPPGPVPPGPKPTPVGPIEKCRQNAKITLDGTNAIKLSPPKTPSEWVTETQAVFDTICSNVLGTALIAMVTQETVIQPFIPTPKDSLNAYSKGRRYIIAGAFVIEFSPHIWIPYEAQPGARADEILLHEFIHMIESNFGGYSDAPDRSLTFDGADFVTVNGTNVYSALQHRNLRKDHADFSELPARYKSNATEHLVLFRENYDLAHTNNAELVRLFKQQSASWNPFAPFLPKNYRTTYFIEILPERRWKWIYDLNYDGTARWRDRNNVAQYGTGRWREEGGRIIIDWNGGSWDNFPRIDFPGQHVDGKNRTAGSEYDSDVYTKGAQPRPA